MVMTLLGAACSLPCQVPVRSVADGEAAAVAGAAAGLGVAAVFAWAAASAAVVNPSAIAATDSRAIQSLFFMCHSLVADECVSSLDVAQGLNRISARRLERLQGQGHKGNDCGNRGGQQEDERVDPRPIRKVLQPVFDGKVGAHRDE